VVISAIDQYEDYAGSEEMLSVSDYVKNRDCAVSVSYPKGFGHTSLAAYIASTYPTAVVLFAFDHYEEFTKKLEEFDLKLNKKSNVLSIYEISYSLNPIPSDGVEVDIEKIKSCIRDKVLVVDHGSKVPIRIKDFFFAIANRAIIFLD
jgi:hypothetical protein